MATPEISILFVCLGNICRSPAAEGVFFARIQRAGLIDRVHCDSAGTAGWHLGKLADPRMRAAAMHRGIALTHRVREVTPADLAKYDLVLAMDHDNHNNLRALDPTGALHDRVRLFAEFCTKHKVTQIPDPYYGGPEDFEHVLDLVEDGCDGLMEWVNARLAARK